MAQKFKGRAVIPGNVEGRAVVSHQGLNSLASFYQSMLVESATATCSDQDNAALFGKVLTGKILCVPKTIGSTSAGATWLTVARTGIAPKAVLFSERIDSLAAAGLALAMVWGGRRIYAVDGLGDGFLSAVQDDQVVEISADGSVVVKSGGDQVNAGRA
jgi:predicted aconitase with swiveling domain